MNSLEYWSDRFQEDWEEKKGREQSRFFYRLGLKEIPEWMTSAIRRENLTVCDWGCALGDGTDLLAKYWETSVTGVDFSENAILQADKKYSKPNFLAIDFLTQNSEASWDIIFSSNTLEHFADPWGTLKKISTQAKKGMIVLVPFEEHERITEHEYTFVNNNIPLFIGNFRLTYSTLVDAGIEEETYWNGKQILLIYTSSEFADKLKLTLNDVQHGVCSALLEAQSENLILEKNLAKTNATLETAQLELLALYKDFNEVREQHYASQMHIHTMKNSVSWRWSAPIRWVGYYARKGKNFVQKTLFAEN